jgi:hypothetical protein
MPTNTNRSHNLRFIHALHRCEQRPIRTHGVVSDYEYIVPPKRDFSHQKITPHIHLASKTQNQA